jgi:hypothetical protein
MRRAEGRGRRVQSIVVRSGQARLHRDIHYIYTDHAQTWTGSVGMSHMWNGTKLSTDVIYGSAERIRKYRPCAVLYACQPRCLARVSVALAQADQLRLDVINLFDSIHEIRNASGIEVFAPQFEPAPHC